MNRKYISNSNPFLNLGEIKHVSDGNLEDSLFSDKIEPKLQNQGFVLILNSADWTIQQVSDNAEFFTGKKPGDMLGKSISCLCSNASLTEWIELSGKSDSDDHKAVTIPLHINGQEQEFYTFLKRMDDVIVLEFERCSPANTNSAGCVTVLQSVISAIHGSQSNQQMCQIAADNIHKICSFDHIGIYQFDHANIACVASANVNVVYEKSICSILAGIDREEFDCLFHDFNSSCFLSDAGSSPVKLLPAVNPVTHKHVDLSGCVLKSFSSDQINVIKKMDAAAFFILPLCTDHNRRGFILGLNQSSRYLSPELRAAGELIRQALTSKLEANSNLEAYHRQLQEKSDHIEVLSNKVKERSERFRLAAESGNLAVWEYDVIQNIVIWDDRMMMLYGIGTQGRPVAYETWSERIHPEDKARTEAELINAINSDNKFDTEFRIILPDGEMRYIKADAIVIKDKKTLSARMIGINKDISKSKIAEQTLKLNEERWQLAVQGSNDGIWDWNMLTNEVYFSPRWKEMLGYEDSEIPNQYEGWKSLVHPEDISAALNKISEYVERKTSVYAMEHRMLHKNGSWVWILARGMAFFNEQGKPYRMIGSHADITERKRAEKTIEKTYQELEEKMLLVNEQATQLESQKYDLEEMNAHLIEVATTDGLTGLKNHITFQERLAEECSGAVRYKTPLSVLLMDVDRFKTFNDEFGHPAGDAILKQVGAILFRCARSSDVVARYGGEEFALILTNTEAAAALKFAERVRKAVENHNWPHRGVTISIGISSLQEDMLTPAALVQAADTALYISKQTGRNRCTHWNKRESDVDKDLQGNLTMPYTRIIEEMMQMQNDTLCSAAEHIRLMMVDAYDATVVSWSRLLDLKDKETEGHSERVTMMMLKMAVQIGMNPEEMLYARWGSLLHDVGKMGIPDDILHKPGSLTEEEWAVMKSHTTIAYDLLWPVSFMRPAIDIPFSHHEKWDGSGYPQGLAGDDIPVSARLFAVADVYDALRSDRPYRKAWSVDKTVAHILSLSGSQFDPRAVKVFLSVIDNINVEMKFAA